MRINLIQRTILSFFVLLAFGLQPVHAQEVTGSISGTVTRRKACAGLHPRLTAASSRLGDTCFNEVAALRAA